MSVHDPDSGAVQPTVERPTQPPGVQASAIEVGCMIEVPSAQITPELRALFDPRMPAGFRCFAVIAGDAAGRIFTDDPILERAA